MAARKKKTPPKNSQQAKPCRKCGGTEFLSQMRNVSIDIGWNLTHLNAVAPCSMCTKCGNKTVTIDAKVGDLSGLIADPDIVAMRQQQAAAAAAANAGAPKKKGAKKKGAKKKATKKKAGRRK
jgi:predicted nucleic-acid-binding Zn-ribbon protein